MKPLHWAEAKDLLLRAGCREREARHALSKNNPDRIPTLQHKLHSQALWSPAAVQLWIEQREKSLTAQAA